MYSRDKKEENVKTQNDEPEVEVSLLHSNRIQFLEGDWQVESVSQFLKKSNDFEDEQQRKTNELSDLAKLETFNYFVKIYEVRMELYGQFLMGSHVSTILKPCDPLDLQALISLTLGIYFCAIP